MRRESESPETKRGTESFGTGIKGTSKAPSREIGTGKRKVTVDEFEVLENMS
jgi:hypothetical protein